MEKEIKENNKNNKGITLVALVITIIILLILAGISIASLTGSGLFEKAKEAKNKTIEKEKLENSILGEYENEIDKINAENDGMVHFSIDGVGYTVPDGTTWNEYLSANNPNGEYGWLYDHSENGVIFYYEYDFGARVCGQYLSGPIKEGREGETANWKGEDVTLYKVLKSDNIEAFRIYITLESSK